MNSNEQMQLSPQAADLSTAAPVPGIAATTAMHQLFRFPKFVEHGSICAQNRLSLFEEGHNWNGIKINF